VRALRQSVFVIPAAAEVARRRSFHDAGLEVETDFVTSSHAQRDDLEAGRAQIAVTAIDNLFAWNAAGADLAVVAQIETTTDLALALRPGLSSIDEREVLRLGVDAPTNGFAIAACSMLAHLGRSPASYELVEVGGVRERFGALADGDIDATLLAPPLDEIGRDRGMGVEMRIGDLGRAYPGLGVVVSRSVLDGRLEEVAAYVRALDDANRWMRGASEGEVRDELAAAGFGPAAVRAALAVLPATLVPSAEGLDVLWDLRERLGMTIADAPRPAELVDLAPLRAAGLLRRS
jgi:ABC-type nitrate/sulfonate/bicarbonate transport system substrate-binding protein